MGEAATIYDITDDWTQCSESEAVRRRTQQQDAALCGKADAVIVCSQGLYDAKRPLARALHLIPNGVDAQHYRRVLDGTGPLPAAASEWRRPVLGYTGTAHRDRLDVELLEGLARRMPHATLVLLGPNHLDAAARRRLDACGNVRMPGAVAYAALPEYMRAFDVCIVPHRVTPFTESLNPIKLWEYLASGKPIVSTPVAGFRDYPQHVRLAGTLDAFVTEIEAALGEAPGDADARRAEAQAHSWVSRVEAIEAVLDSAVAARGRAGAMGEVVHA